LWIPHIDGIPFRKLGDEYGLSGKQTYLRVFAELAQLPKVIDITKQYCRYTCGILIMDGKYIKVRGFKQKIPWIYAIDYATHDILFSLVAESEDIQAFETFFTILKSLDYPLRVVVADDRSSLPLGLKRIYPDIPVQLCQNHYLENIRQQLHIRTDPTHRYFFNSLKLHVFDEYDNDATLNVALHHVFTERCEGWELRQKIVLEISKRRQELFAYKTIPNCPNNTNLIELFNSHFNARLRTLKGFKTEPHALLWLNGLILRRRTKPFTDCSTKFKYLNGKCSLQVSLKPGVQFPEILGVKAPKR
jgi:transposase-like protein